MNELNEMHLAIMFGRYELLKNLLDNGIDPNTVSSSGKTPLHLVMELDLPLEECLFDALMDSRIKVLELLLERGGEINARDHSGRTPLMSSIRSNIDENVVLTRILLDHGADPLIQDKDGHTAFHHACDFKKPDILALLIEYGPSITEFPIGKDHRTLLHLVASCSTKLFINLLKSTPVDFINTYCVYLEGRVLDEMISLPCCLIQNRDLEGLEALLNYQGVIDSVLTCPIVSELCRGVYSPVAFAFVKDTHSDFSLKIIQLFVDRNLAIDPEYPIKAKMSFGDADVFTCLEILVDVHEFHLSKHSNGICKCAQLFILLLEKGARLKPFNSFSQDVISPQVLRFVNVHCSIFGLVYLLKFSLEPHTLLNMFVSFVTSKTKYNVIPRYRSKIIHFLMSICNPGDIKRIRERLKEQNLPVLSGLLNSLSYEFVDFPSLKCLSRCTVRKQCKFELESINCEGRRFSSYLSELPLPKPLLSYLEYGDLITSLKTHPSYPSFTIDTIP